jgi:DNA polymerase III epsilon subunit-like protein
MIYLSIDIEADGPVPGEYSMLSLGAVPVIRREGTWTVTAHRFYAELEPLEGAKVQPAAQAVGALHLEGAATAPDAAMTAFAAFIAEIKLELGDERVVAAAKPTAFDCAFVNYYFWRYLGENPLGHSAFDLGSYLQGRFPARNWGQRTKMMKRAGYIKPSNPKDHHALADALEQAEVLAWALGLEHASDSPVSSVSSSFGGATASW